METRHTPDPEQAAKLQSLPMDAPVAALNLFRFRERAAYQEGDPEFGTEAAQVSGQEAYARYAAEAGPKIASLGGRVAFSTPVDQLMIGPPEQQWDVAAVMFFPTRQAFVAMLSDPAFAESSRHRRAALENHLMLHLDGTPFVES